MDGGIGPSEVEELKALTQHCIDDFEFFARTCLRIRTKTGEIRPFRLNRAQREFHRLAEKQRASTNRVRIITLKARQLGISTYLQGRYYWLLWRAKEGMALNAFILTHEDKATYNLFGMAKTYHEYMPAHLKPPTKAANAQELIFADSGCGYSVATAGTREVGRSSTIQLFHGSEVAIWPNAESHITSLLTTAVADAPGTESVLESTANGVGNVFHRYWQAAIRGDSEYEAIFLPWFWDEGYVADCPDGWEAPEEFHEYGSLHDLTWEQLYWAYVKNRTLAQANSLPDDRICPQFRQEYPATAEEAFQSSGNSFIPAISVLRARKPEESIIGRGPVILGVDPARSNDKVGIIDRCGRRLGERICVRMDPGGNLMHVAGEVARIIDRIRPDAVNIDVGGNGAGVVDALIELGYGHCVNAVNFGSKPLGMGPTGDKLYLNRRAEMHDEMREWFEIEGGVQIPDDEGLHADLTAAVWGPQATRHNTANQLVLEEKDKIKARLGASPDLGDAAALTFAVPFSFIAAAKAQPPPKRARKNRTGY